MTRGEDVLSHSVLEVAFRDGGWKPVLFEEDVMEM